MRCLTLALPTIAVLAILMILTPHSLRAEGKFDVWAMIHEGKVEAVREALASTDLAEQRTAFAAFRTSDPVVGAFSESLLAETPDDPKAMTARGWYLFAAGWTMRGGEYARHVFPEAKQRMAEMHAEADVLAQAALAADPTLIAASDLWMSLSKTTGRIRIVPDEVERVMALVPNRRSLIIAAAALAPQWGGSEDHGKRLCENWATKIADVEDYTVEICQLDVIFAANYLGEARQAAYGQIGEIKHHVLDGPRLSWLFSGGATEAEQLAVLQDLEDSGKLTLDHARLWDRLEGNAGWDGPNSLPGPRALDALETVLPMMRAEADFDPGDGGTLSLYIDALIWQGMADGSRFPTEELEARFGALFAVAPYDPEIWTGLAYYRSMFIDEATMTIADVETVRTAYVNAAYYSNHAPEFVSNLFNFNLMFWESLDKRNLLAMDATGEPAFDREEFNDGVVCPMIRSIRVLDALCDGGPSRPQGCPEYAMMMNGDPRPKLIERARARKACSVEFESDANDLYYTKVPIDLPK